MFRPALRICTRRAAPLRMTGVSVKRSFASTSGPVFDWQDPLASKQLLTEEELAIADTAERYCQERLLPRVLGRQPQYTEQWSLLVV